MDTSYVYGVAGVLILATLIEMEPKWGGWLLLLTTIALLSSPKARAIITFRG